MTDNFTVEKSTLSGSQFLPQRAEASACGKTIIVGEHAVVYGARAIAMPLQQMQVSIQLKPAIKGLSKQLIHFKLGESPLSRHGCGIVTDALRLLGITPFPMSISGSSRLPIGGGLGSSAALSVVVLRLLAKSVGMTLSPQDLAFFANKLEARFHGTPSGLDTAVVAYENCICFRKNPPLLTAIPLAHAPGTKPWKFALIDSGIRASTLAMIRLAAPYFAGTRGEKRVQQFDKLADQVMASIEHHDIFSLADAMNSAAQLLKKSGIVTEQLSSLIDQIRSIGVLAAKTTGAGGGGFVLALMHPDQEERQMKAMEQKFGAGNVHFVELGCSNGNY